MAMVMIALIVRGQTSFLDLTRHIPSTPHRISSLPVQLTHHRTLTIKRAAASFCLLPLELPSGGSHEVHALRPPRAWKHVFVPLFCLQTIQKTGATYSVLATVSLNRSGEERGSTSPHKFPIKLTTP